MQPVLIVLVYALAVARVTRLITADKITEMMRTRLAVRLWARTIPLDEAHAWASRTHRDGDPALIAGPGRRLIAMERIQDDADPPLVVYLLSCPWCASIYVGALVAPLAYFWGSSPWLFVPALALAFSYFSGFAAGRE